MKLKAARVGCGFFFTGAGAGGGVGSADASFSLVSLSLSSFFFSFFLSQLTIHFLRLVVTGGVDQFIRVFDARDIQKDPATMDHCNDAVNAVLVTVILSFSPSS